MLKRNVGAPPRLLHIVGESRFGGAAKIILGLAEMARQVGWQVDVLTTDPLFQEAVRQRGLGLVALDVVRREIRPVWDVAGLIRLRSFLSRHNYDMVHTHTSKGGFVGRLAARLAGVPVVVHTAHGFAFHESTPACVRRFYSTLERIASGWCDRIISVSEFHREWAIQLKICSPLRIVAIPNGIPECRRTASNVRAELRKQLGVSNSELLFLNVSRLVAGKGLEYLLEAVGLLPSNRKHIRFVIAGEGPQRKRLEQLASRLMLKDRLIFTGFRDDVGDLLAACDAVVLPSLREGLSISLLEAMAAGKPIVATSIGSHREVAAHAEVALLVRPADSLRLCEAILRLSGDQNMADRLGRNAQAVYRRFYTEERMLRSYRQLYLDLLSPLQARWPALDRDVLATASSSVREHQQPRIDRP
jgi:glycosyltransferase involved in cell wall biosynthesis